MAIFVEHDLVDYVNAGSTAVVALFTVAMFFVVKYQLQASKDIERAWVMPFLNRDQFSELFLCENKSVQGTNMSVTTTAFLQLKLNNNGSGPVWIKQFKARMVLVDSEEELPHQLNLKKEDDQHWYPAPFVESETVRFKLSTNGSRVAKNLLIVYGKVDYLDKFREERFSTFGYIIKDDHGNFERLKAQSEYNRNT